MLKVFSFNILSMILLAKFHTLYSHLFTNEQPEKCHHPPAIHAKIVVAGISHAQIRSIDSSIKFFSGTIRIISHTVIDFWLHSVSLSWDGSNPILPPTPQTDLMYQSSFLSMVPQGKKLYEQICLSIWLLLYLCTIF